jgi:DNA polymerase III subunit gamma/tau
MSYQVLARKWRPKNFSEMAGQAHVLQTLSHALEQQRLHHAYLFTGTRGVGKTTVARILARCLNCETGITATPCGQCDACREISEGRFIDLIEVDAASRTRVEDTRELLENVQYAPSRGRFKVYLIDEVHMLSAHSFNALLKTLEEPPPHVKFLLATTDPQKLPVTVLSRCLQFHLKNLAPQQIVNYLQSVLTAEQIEFEDEALWQLARAANGSMRDALTLLDQSISFGEGRVHNLAVTALLGTPDHKLVFSLIEALKERDGERLLNDIAQAAENNPDFERLMSAMAELLHRLALAQTVPGAIDNSQGDRQLVQSLAGQLAAEDVQLYYQFALQCIQEMKFTPDKRMSFEMSLIRMLAFSPDVFDDNVTEKKKPLSHELTEQPPAPSVAREAEAGSIAASPADPEPEPEPESEPESESEPASEPEPEEKIQRTHPVNSEQSDNGLTAQTTLTDIENWYRLVEQCRISGISANILWNCIPVSQTAEHMDLLLDENQSALYSADQDLHIARALSEVSGREITVSISKSALSIETPAQRRARIKREAIEALHHSFHNDPGVVSLVTTFDARIEQLRTHYERT